MSTPVHFPSDFPDRISPMLVKELRQGLRAKTFVAMFLSLQIFLAVMLFSAGAASTSDYVGSVISGIIFTFFSIAVIVVQPLRGTSALSSEVKGNTIDMMVLTRLSAWRIVFGKWVAIVSQSALLLTTIIPYLILRYFFGGMNLVSEMVFLLVIFLTSMALTALTVGLSGCHSVIVRSLVPIIGLPILLWSMLIVSFSYGFRGSGNVLDVFNLDNTDSQTGVGCYVAAIVYLGMSMLSMGASLIAPAAENHAILRRLVALLAMFALIPVAALDAFDGEWTILLATIVGVPAILIALTDSAPLVATVCKPFVKRGPIARVIGRLFYPTWSSGVIFSMLLAIIGIAAVFGQSLLHGGSPEWDDSDTIVILSLVGGMFFPSVWQVFLFKGESQRLGHYLLLLAGSFVMMGVLTALADSMNSGAFLWFFAWHPFAFISMLEESHAPNEVLSISVALLDLIIFAILTVKAMIDIRKSAPVIQEAQNPIEQAG